MADEFPLVDGLRVRVITEEGELIRELVLDPDRDYQPHGHDVGAEPPGTFGEWVGPDVVPVSW